MRQQHGGSDVAVLNLDSRVHMCVCWSNIFTEAVKTTMGVVAIVRLFEHTAFCCQVQTEDQYIFIHDALLEAINCGNTELPAGDLYNHLHRLTTPASDSPVTGMEIEFKVRREILCFISSWQTGG